MTLARIQSAEFGLTWIAARSFGLAPPATSKAPLTFNSASNFDRSPSSRLTVSSIRAYVCSATTTFSSDCCMASRLSLAIISSSAGFIIRPLSSSVVGTSMSLSMSSTPRLLLSPVFLGTSPSSSSSPLDSSDAVPTPRFLFLVGSVRFKTVCSARWTYASSAALSLTTISEEDLSKSLTRSKFLRMSLGKSDMCSTKDSRNVSSPDISAPFKTQGGSNKHRKCSESTLERSRSHGLIDAGKQITHGEDTKMLQLLISDPILLC
mmetsp:Transcript_12797/g.27096  ORF Transcript_12797/g.27096 Transcript_12797/m.27096 type:complete len:264 (+) Transcript_12797:565-1356(+)